MYQDQTPLFSSFYDDRKYTGKFRVSVMYSWRIPSYLNLFYLFILFFSIHVIIFRYNMYVGLKCYSICTKIIIIFIYLFVHLFVVHSVLIHWHAGRLAAEEQNRKCVVTQA